MGNVTGVIKKKNVRPYGKANIVDISPSASYATGGETIPFSVLGIGNRVSFIIVGSNAGGYNAQIIYGATEFVAPKLKIFQGDNANVAAAPGSEVPNAANLSAQTFRVEVFASPYR